MPMIGHVHPGRIAPAVTRFATAPTPWTAAALAAAVHRMVAGRGWTLRTAQVQPAAYLARLLRDLDHLDQDTAPAGAQDPAQVEALRQERALAREREQAAQQQHCAHGVAGADPITGYAFRCAFCRHT
jgi:hypothetical protein